MAHMDIFNDDAFGVVEMTDAVERIPYTPGLLGAMNLFAPKPVSTETVSIESRDGRLSIIQTSERGAPLESAKLRNRRNIRAFRTYRLAKGDTIKASEIQGVRAFGSETEMEQVQSVVATRMADLRADLELTMELHRLGAIQGLVLDADGSVIVDWFNEWGITRPAPLEFRLDTASTDVELKCRDVLRSMQVASKGAWTPGARVAALAGDSFFDKLTSHPTVKETYRNTSQAEQLRRAFGPAGETMAGAFAVYEYGGILFINYRGADTFNGANPAASGVESIGVADNQVKLFPMGARGVFQCAFSPAESFEFVNTPGREVYAMTVPDRDRNMFVDVEVYSYPLMICTRPEMLMAGFENVAP